MLTRGNGVKGHPLKMLEKKKKKNQCKDHTLSNTPSLDHKLVMTAHIRADFIRNAAP